MPLNDQQRDVVECLEGSVNVVAGAGTGKTFTLTQRIIAAVQRVLRDDPEDDDPTSHILAITFTRKAAGELKSRVRSAFLEAASEDEDGLGGRYLECALRIDSAWISTIHGMASRILRENAIDFNIDPNFKTLTAQGEAIVFSKALQMALDDVMASGDEDLIGFIMERDLESGSRMTHSLADAVRDVIASTSYMPGGLDGIEVLRSTVIACEVVQPFIEQASLVRRLFDLGGWSKGDEKKIPQLADELDAALDTMNVWLEAHGSDGEEGIDGFFEALYAFPTTTNKFGKGSEHFDEMLRYRLELRAVSEKVGMAQASMKAELLLRFASMVKEHMDALKQTGRTKFTESDLLVVCNQRLSDPANLSVLERYREQFRFIMLDEFQDTDPLQMDIIKKIAVQPDGNAGIHPLSNVCTVGDMQQSIYRFRGGDVEETQKRIESMRQGQGKQFALTGNYRSHRDVLEAVKDVFSQPQAFGDEFLDLFAARTESNAEGSPYGSPRIEFEFMHGRRASKKDDIAGVSSADVRQACARQVALHFKKLSDAGARPSQMALLLGGMPKAGVYARALRDLGFECVITGGSVFADTIEAKTVRALLAYAVNQHDDEALLFVLTSNLFQISDDALLALVRRPDCSDAKPLSLSSSLLGFEGIPELNDDDNAAVALAREVLSRFVSEARRSSPARALGHAFADSGRLLSLQEDPLSQSMSDAGNIAKAIGIVHDIECDSSGIAEVSAKYAAHLVSSKEAPGVLAASGSEYIQIMTVHSSKGLEFDHVALAEIGDGTQGQQRVPLVMENIDGKSYLSYGVSKADFDDPSLHDAYGKVMGFTFEEIGLDPTGRPLGETTQADGETKRAYACRKKQAIKDARTYELRHELLSEYHATQELEEARRLMYVAMTRAKETLFVTYGTTVKPESGYKGTFSDIHSALAKRFDALETGFDDTFLVADSTIRARRIAFESQEAFKEFMGIDEEEGTNVEDQTQEVRYVNVPLYDEDPVPSAVGPYNHSRQGIYSYTSLSRGLPEDEAQAEDKLEDSALPYEDELAFIDDEMSLMMGVLDFEEKMQEDATSLGTAFHRLCQRAIITAALEGSHELRVPPEEAIDAQARQLDLTHSQRARLHAALRLWFESDLARYFAGHSSFAAEVPFAVAVEAGGDSRFVLEGEIDALADNGDGHALLIDYKTGRMDGISLDALRKKHLLQSQCYAYALLKGGYKTVTAYFVKVEESRLPESTGELSEAGGVSQPIAVEYSYSLDDVCRLQDDLTTAYQYSMDIRSAD